MNVLKLSLFTSALLFSGFAVTAQSADDIINKHITAIGGTDNWKKVNSMKMTGTMMMQGNEVKITRTMVHNKAMRMDMDIMGQNNYVILTTTGGWQYFPVMGQAKAEAMPAESLKDVQDQLSLTDKILAHKLAGDKAAYVSKEKVADKDCHKLTIIDKKGDVLTAYFDATSGLLTKTTQKVEVQGGQKDDDITTFGNYKKLPEGISVPMLLSSTMNGDITVSSIDVNKPVDENIFKPAN